MGVTGPGADDRGMKLLRLLVVPVFALAGACSASPEAKPAAGVVETTQTTVAAVQKPADVPAEMSYANCDTVRAAGKAPISKGQPGYSAKLDRDGDGVACDN